MKKLEQPQRTRLKSLLLRMSYSTLSIRQQRRIAQFDLLNKKRNGTTKKRSRISNSKISSSLLRSNKRSVSIENKFYFDRLNDNINEIHNECNVNLNTNNQGTADSQNNLIVRNEVSDDLLVNCTTNIVKDSSNNLELHSRKKVCKNTINTFQDFKKKLIRVFIETNMNFTQQKHVLNLLNTHHCFSSLPKDPRTLLQTPRIFKGKLINVFPGEYLHLGLETALIKILHQTQAHLIPSDKLLIDFNIDGCPLNKKFEIIPIQVLISNIPESNVGVVGIYKGRKKAIEIELFLEHFIRDTKKLRENGLEYNKKLLNVDIRICCLDLVARAYLLRHKSHTAKSPCSKCKVTGIRYKNTTIYLKVGHELRTDEDYTLISDKSHHVEKSPLLKLGIGLVTQVPIDGMHCVYLGIHKKMLFAWTKGTYGKNVKLSAAQILQISNRIKTVSKFCPREFARLPETLEYIKDFKATQHRQFLLYFGAAVLNGIIKEEVYIHYLILCAAIRCLVMQNPSVLQLSFAKLALERFILDAELIYDLNFMSYNVHNLCHLVKDVERYGPLDSYAAWPYENNMSFFKKHCKKPGATLQQIYNRLKEKEIHSIDSLRIVKSENHVRLFNPTHKGLVPHNVPNYVLKSWKMFKNVEFKNFTLGTELKDSTCILEDSSICLVKNIYKVNENLVYILIQKFTLIENLFDIGIESAVVGIYKCSMLATETQLVEHSFVVKKCYRMPYWKSNDDNDSFLSEYDDDPVPNVYIVSVIV